MSGIGFTVGLIVALFVVARFWAERHDVCLTLRDPVFWSIAVLACAIARIDTTHGVRATIVLAACAVCAATDRQTGYIFDVVVGSAGAALLGYIAATSAIGDAGGAIVCGGAVLLPYLATRGRGMGLGDVKLAALIGAGLSVRNGLFAIAAAFVAGAVVAIVGLASGRFERGDAMRFAPYLAAGSIVSVALYGAP